MIIKAFKDATDILLPFNIYEMWDPTAERAIKEQRAVKIPEGADEQIFKENYLKNKKGK